MDAINGRLGLITKISQIEQKQKSDKVEMEKLMAGKKTLKSFFKSASSKENDINNLRVAIDRANADIDDYGRLIHFLTIYLSEGAIDKFKNQKAALYFKLMNVFCVREIALAHQQATMWHSMLDVVNQ